MSPPAILRSRRASTVKRSSILSFSSFLDPVIPRSEAKRNDEEPACPRQHRCRKGQAGSSSLPLLGMTSEKLMTLQKPKTCGPAHAYSFVTDNHDESRAPLTAASQSPSDVHTDRPRVLHASRTLCLRREEFLARPPQWPSETPHPDSPPPAPFSRLIRPATPD